VTTFLVDQYLLEKDETFMTSSSIRNDQESLTNWASALVASKGAEKEDHPTSGKRVKKKFYCKIKNTYDGISYMVEGEFQPNHEALDPNSSRRLDILRCKINNSKQAYLDLARKEDKMMIEIYREDDALIKFDIPWSSRVQSSYLNRPTNQGGGSDNPIGTIFDPWKGFNRETPGVWTRDALYMCVPGLETTPSRKFLPIYLEFIQHHLNMGASHIFLTATFTQGGAMMNKLLRIFRSFIEDGSVSMNSHSDDDIDFTYSTRGFRWTRDTAKVFQTNLCTYFSKGTADYVGVWDLEEFFIPKGENKDLLDVIRKATVPDYKDVGLPDGHKHPFCFLGLDSEVIGNKELNNIDMAHLWIGERFPHSVEPDTHSLHKKKGSGNSIIPTDTVFQVGLHGSGTCRLHYPHNGGPDHSLNNSVSTEFCHRRDNTTNYEDKIMDYFDDRVLSRDVKEIDMNNEGSLYHIMVNAAHEIVSNMTDMNQRNDYSLKYFPLVYQKLKKRKLDLLVDIPPRGAKVPYDPVNWVDWDIVYRSRHIMGSLISP